MIYFFAIVLSLLTAAAVLVTGSSSSGAPPYQAEAAAKIFRGISTAKAIADQNFSLTGKYEANATSLYSPYQEVPFPTSSPVAAPPPVHVRVSAYTNGLLTPQITFPTRPLQGSSADVYWPRTSTYFLACAPLRIPDASSLKRPPTCDAQSAQHRYLLVTFTSADGTCSMDSASQASAFFSTLQEAAPAWAKTLGTDVWAARPDPTSNLSSYVPVCPQVWVYLGKNP